MKISKSRTLLLTPLLLLMLLMPLVLVTVVYASPPTLASGTYTSGPINIIDLHQAGGNTIITFNRTSDFTGTIFGPVDLVEGTAIFHPDGRVTARAILECACTVEGKSGTLVLHAIFSPGGSFGKFTIVSGTGDLENLQGTVNVIPVAPDVFSYSGRIHFGP